MTKLGKHTEVDLITMNPTMTLEQIDPGVASAYLDKAAPNRQTRQGVIEQYARDMAAGRWHSSVIRFAADGQLWDGQHRLWAVIESDTTQGFWVERGIPVDAIPTIDVGMRRTVGDIFAIRGEHSANILAASVRLVRHLLLYPGRAPSGGSRFSASSSEAIDFLETHPGIRDHIPQARRIASAIRLAPSIAAGLRYLEGLRSEVKAAEFWDQIETGANQVAETGAWALRQVVILDATRSGTERNDQNMTVALAIKAWNFWEQDRVVKALRWQRNGGEAFPILGKR